MEKILEKLPSEAAAGDVQSDVQRVLVNRLAQLRYNPPPITRAVRPKKKDKLPAGETYTCRAKDNVPTEDDSTTDEEMPDPAPRTRNRVLKESSDSSDYSDSSGTGTSDDERSLAVRKIIARLSKYKKRPREEEKEDDVEAEHQRDDVEEEPEEDNEVEDNDVEVEHQEAETGGLEHKKLQPEQAGVLHKKPEEPPAYLPESFIVAAYLGDWYVGEVIEKNGQPEAEPSEEYLLVSFMEKMPGDLLKWPRKPDILNTLKVGLLPCYGTVSYCTEHSVL